MNARFYDSSVPHEDEKGVANIVSGMGIYLPPVMPVELSTVLNRPYLLTTYNWTSSAVIRTAADTRTLPHDLLEIVNIADKLAYIQYISPDMELEYQINGTKFHYGRLMLSVRPQVTGLDSAYLQPEGSSTWPQWYQLSANSQQSIKIRLPWKNITRRMHMHTLTELFSNTYEVVTTVAVPLSSAYTATPAPVTLSIYGRFIDTRAAGFAPSFVAQSSEELLELMSLDTTAIPVDPPVKTSGIASGMLTKVSNIAKDASILAREAGFCNPINPAVTSAMQVRQPLFSKVDDVPLSVNLGPSQVAKLERNSSSVNAAVDEMNIVDIVSHPSLVATGIITSGNVSGDTLYNAYLNPAICVYSDYAYTPTGGIFQANPQYYLARMFRLWRGSFKFHISFVCSSFHSCRCRFIWVPSIQVSGITLPATNEEVGNSYNVVMDINKETEYSIHIPFYPTTDWLEMLQSGVDRSFNINGQVVLQLQTPLTSVMTTPSSIYFQIFLSMGDDTQFAAPSLIDAIAYGNPNYAGIEFAEEEELEAQSSETLLCELPSSSSACLRDTKYINIGGCESRFDRLHGDATAYEFVSVKQLTNMLTPFYNVTADTAHNYNGVQVCPFGTLNLTYNDAIWNCFFAQIRAIYRFGRGGIRFMGMSSGASLQGSANLEPVAGTAANQVYQAQTDRFPGFTAGDIKYVSAGYQYIANSSFQPLDIVMPYYASVPCQRFDSSNASVDFPHGTSTATLMFSTQGTAPQMCFFMATGDDFEFGTRISVPTLKKSP